MIIFFIGNGLFILIGILLLILLAAGSAAAVWMVEHAVGVGVVLLIFWIFNTVGIILNLRGNTRRSAYSAVLGMIHALPQIPAVVVGYQYLTRQIKCVGIGEAILDFAVCMGIYLAAGAIWKNVVVRDKAGPAAAIFLSVVYLGISAFFIIAFATQ